MDCATFQDELVELLALPQLDPDGTRRERLRAHALGCTDCADGEGLLEWLALPLDQRDAEDPGRLYWEGFDQRLRQRIANQAPLRTVRPSPRRWRMVAAAVVVGALIAGWWLGRGAGGGHASPDPPEAIRAAEAAGTLEELEQIEQLFAPSVALDLTGAETDIEGADGWLLPSTAGLDAADRRELLRWLRDRQAALQGGQA